MKFVVTATVFLVLLIPGPLLVAGEIYTWMDDNGILTITDHPPFDSARVRHVTRYKDRPAEEQKEGQSVEVKLPQDLPRQQKIAAAQASRDQATAARKKAEAAIHRAKEAEQNLLNYAEKYGTKKKKRKKHRSRIKTLAETAGAAKTRADEEIKRSNQAAEKSWEADKRAEETEVQP